MTNLAYNTASYDDKKLFTEYAGLVSKVTRRLVRKYPGNDDIEDMKQYGYIGLLEAISRFNPNRGIKFETYAVIRIQGAILDAKRKADWVPRSTRSRVKEINYIKQELQAKLHRNPTVFELADELNMTVPEFMKLQSKLDTRTPLRLDQQDDDSNSLADTLASHDRSPEEETAKRALYAKLTASKNTLSDREQNIVNWYYYEGKSFKEISIRLGLTESRISQLHTQICERLRKSISK